MTAQILPLPLPPSPSSGPEVGPILELHRGEDSFVAFARKDPAGDWQNLYSVQVSWLESLFPSMREDLEADAFFSVNSFYRPGHGKSKVRPALPTLYRNSEGLRYLNAVFADCDGYQRGLTPGDVVGALIDAMEEQRIPPPSMISLSGRGVWLFWFLHRAKDPQRPQEAFADRVEIYRLIQCELGDRLGSMGADAGARDPARVTRVPGSLHRGSGKRVQYLLPADSAGCGFSYTLDELATFLGIDTRRHRVVERAFGHTKPGTKPEGAARGETNQNKARGWEALHRIRLAQFRVLLAGRGGGFEEGCRNKRRLYLRPAAQ